jgi:hypothetical protein
MMLFLCAERRARTPARSIDAAIVKERGYGCDCRLANGIYRHNSTIRPDHRDFIMRDSRAYGKSDILSHGRTRIFTDEPGIEELAATRCTVQPRGSGERFGRTANETRKRVVLIL